MSSSSSTADTIVDITSLCANCGKGDESTGDLKSCTACKLVKYCNRDCQIAHRPQHKKACKKRAAELHYEALFQEPPPREECPICTLLLPFDANQSSFKCCCGKVICAGCLHTMMKEEKRKGKKKIEELLCPFCRTPAHSSDEEEVKRVKKMMEKGNSMAYYQFGCFYASGHCGLPQDWVKANESWLKGGELGYALAYFNLGNSYANGMGVEIHKKKAVHYHELAAMMGGVYARHGLGCMEVRAGNYHRAKKHFLLAARAGYKESLDNIKQGYTIGHVKKDEYANVLRDEYQKSQDETKSEARDKALANVQRYTMLGDDVR